MRGSSRIFNVYLKLKNGVTATQLEQLLARFGEIEKCEVRKLAGKTFGGILYTDTQSADEAIRALKAGHPAWSDGGCLDADKLPYAVADLNELSVQKYGMGGCQVPSFYGDFKNNSAPRPTSHYDKDARHGLEFPKTQEDKSNNLELLSISPRSLREESKTLRANRELFETSLTDLDAWKLRHSEKELVPMPPRRCHIEGCEGDSSKCGFYFGTHPCTEGDRCIKCHHDDHYKKRVSRRRRHGAQSSTFCPYTNLGGARDLASS